MTTEERNQKLNTIEGQILSNLSNSSARAAEWEMATKWAEIYRIFTVAKSNAVGIDLAVK